MRVGAEALAGGDQVVVDHQQVGEAHLFRVVVVAERERVARIEPAELCVAALGGGSQFKHGASFLVLPGTAAGAVPAGDQPLIASMAMLMVTSSPTWGAYLPALNSLRFTTTLASAPMASFLSIGWGIAT